MSVERKAHPILSAPLQQQNMTEQPLPSREKLLR
jgi:hypothetical protein